MTFPPSRLTAFSTLICLVLALFAHTALGQSNEPPPGFQGATVVEKPDARVPLDVEFQDEDGRPVKLDDFFQTGRPVLLALVYYRCPMLCNLTLNGVVKAIRPMNLIPGRDYEIVTASFDPREGPELARAKKENYIKELGKPEAAGGWHFLSSDKPAAARAIGDAIGFGYKLDPKGEQYLHQAAIYICTPDGRVARTIQGVEFDTDMLHDSLVNASAGKISRGLFGAALSCGLMHFDQATGKYVWAAVAIMRVTGITTVLVLATVIGTLMYRDTKKRRGQGIGDRG
jgi:protein SCO1